MFTIWEIRVVWMRGVKEEKSSLNALLNTYDPEKKNRSDDIRDPDVIIVPRGELFTTSSKSSLRDSFSL